MKLDIQILAGKEGRRSDLDDFGKPVEISELYMKIRHKFWGYSLSFAFWETFNIFTIIASFYITNVLLNDQFLSYGIRVASGMPFDKGQNAMVSLFPTEVRFCFVETFPCSKYCKDKIVFFCV